jgi:hypothetical protein
LELVAWGAAFFQSAHVIRSLAGHLLAGLSTGEEEKAFREF